MRKSAVFASGKTLGSLDTAYVHAQIGRICRIVVSRINNGLLLESRAEATALLKRRSRTRRWQC